VKDLVITDLIIIPTRAEVRMVSRLASWQTMPTKKVCQELALLNPIPRSILVSEGIGGGMLVPLFPMVEPEQAEGVIALDSLIHLAELTKEAREISQNDSDNQGLETCKPWPWHIKKGMAVRRALVRLRSGSANNELNLDPSRALCYILTLLEEGSTISETTLWDCLGHDFVAYIFAAVREGNILFDLDDYGLSHADILSDEHLGLAYERSLNLGYERLESELFERLEVIRTSIGQEEEKRLEEIQDDLGARVEKVQKILKKEQTSFDELLEELGI
jgi:hypothetical protein